MLLVALTAALYGPALGLELIGDDYQHLQPAHLFLVHPAHPFPPVGQWFRPLTTWTMALDLAIWGHRPVGFHLSNLLFGVGAAVLLVAAARRLGLRRSAAWLVGGLWISSPFASEALISVCIRHELFLMAAWLGLVWAWPRSGEDWTRRRLVVVSFCVMAGLLSKETWVVTPALVAVLAWSQQGRRWRSVLWPTVLTGAAAALYVAARFALIPGTGGYFELSPRPLLKLPHMLAAFLQLEDLVPGGFRVTATSLVGLVVVVALVVVAVRARLASGAVGAALVVLPLVPVALVPYLPQRYAAIPYAGFLLLVGGLVEHGLGKLEGRPRRYVGAVVLVLAAGVMVRGAALVHRNLEDWQRISGWHTVLLNEATRVVSVVEDGEPVAVVRAERRSPLEEVAQTPRGLAKPLYVRREDPYGLVDAAALFEWVAGEHGLVVNRVDDWRVRCKGEPGALLIHRDGGFKVVRRVPDLAKTAEGWSAAGMPVRVIQARRVE